MNSSAGPDAGIIRTRLSSGLRTWGWGWAAIGHLVLDLVLTLGYLGLLLAALLGIVLLPVLLIGLPLLALALITAFGLAHLERARLLALTGVAVAAPAAPAAGPAWRRLLDRRPWLALGYCAALLAWGGAAGTTITVLIGTALAAAAVPAYASALPDDGLNLPFGGEVSGFWGLTLVCVLGLAGLVLVPLLARVLVLVDALLVRLLLGPGRNEQVEQLAERVDTLSRTREATVDSVEMERRRIERDLHDGPQQRLVAIAMDLGMARERIDRDPTGARTLLDQAHAASKEAITEMRMVARGIHPPILTDRGLDAALSALAARSPVPVTVRVDLPVRPSPTVEAIAYFCVSEALTNVAKHAHATRAGVEVTAAAPAGLRIEIRDDGIGGAAPGTGTWLPGLADRVRAIDGSLDVHSPAGGPTVLTVSLPGGRS